MTVTQGCLTTAAGVATTVNIHYEYRDNAAGNAVLHATRYTNAAGVPVVPAGTDVITAGACAISPPDVEFEILCDKLTDGTIIDFVRRTVTTFSATGAPTTVIANFGMDYLTPYTLQGGAVACNQDCDAVAPVGLVTTWG